MNNLAGSLPRDGCTGFHEKPDLPVRNQQRISRTHGESTATFGKREQSRPGGTWSVRTPGARAGSFFTRDAVGECLGRRLQCLG